jgi:acyl dehydratase
MSTVELDKSPRPGALYRRAALGLLPGRRLLPGGPTGELPDTELVLRGVTVDRSHLAGYDRVCGFRLTDALPATYPHILAFPLALRLMSGPDFPFPAVGVVHVTNQIEVLRPIDAGERLDFSVRAADLRPHERGRQFDVVASASVDGELVWRGVSTYLRKGSSSGETDGRHRERSAPPPASALWRVEPRVGTDYAAVSGDRNPIHTSTVAAKLFGFPRRIAHGMWSKARCLAALEGRLPDRYTVEVGFKLPILLPSSVAFSAVAEAGGSWSMALHDARSGKPHLSGTIARRPEPARD